MVNSRDPAVIAQDSWMVEKFWHILAGLYFWEFITTLDYEWGVIRRRRPYRWTIVIYSVMRVATLMNLILILFRMNVTIPFNCQAEVTVQFIFGYMSFAAASLLIVLRIIAIWNRTKLAKGIAIGIWVINLGFLIHNVVQIRGAWAVDNCVTVNVLSIKLIAITILITVITLLLIALVGLLRLGFHEASVFGLGDLMWKQGLIWLFPASIAYVPLVVLISLDLNDPLNYMFHLPASIMMSIAATRIYRSLMNFCSRSTDIANLTDKHHPIDFTLPTSKTNRAQPILLGPVEVVEQKTYEQYQTSQANQYTSTISGGGSLHDTPASLGLDYDVEGSAESRTLAQRQ